MSTATAVRPDEAAVRAAVEGVPDPELPPVTLGMLGMVETVEVASDGTVFVELLPTFSGCPATEMMSRDVREALAGVDGVGEVTIRWRHTPVWTTERINAEGHQRLREFGIAPPTGGGPVSTVSSQGRPSLPIAQVGTHPHAHPETDPDVDPHVDPDLDPDAPPAHGVACPFCGEAERVEEDSPFGPTPCRASWFCNACRQPFERFKDL